MKKYFLYLILFGLVGCAANPNSYIEAKSSPIINIEADLNDQIKVKAQRDRLELLNLRPIPTELSYKLFWYDELGVSQPIAGRESSEWHYQKLLPQEERTIFVERATEESRNYRVYLRAAKNLNTF